MKWHVQHEAFKRLTIQQGIQRLEDFKQAAPFGYTVPQARIDRWLRNTLEVPTRFSSQRRYVNRFKLGADPEFIFSNGAQRMDAKSLGLHQGLAFGMDNNGRLVELRPYPSRSALEVVASLLAAMRWLAILHPMTLALEWHAGAFLQGDGIGGHVHFGRKRPGRDFEVKALDVIEEELLALRAYPIAEVLRRRQGDEHRNPAYGLLGDIRKQMHGYEYRTFPSWLDSPELAFLTLTLSKLAVHNPGLTQGYPQLAPVNRAVQRIKNLLSYYKDIDDDARLALQMICRRFPTHVGGDFKPRWGIGRPPEEPPKITFVPACIEAAEADTAELFARFSTGAPLGRPPVPTWAPLNPPEGYFMTLKNTSTHGAKGLGEILWDVCQSKEFKYRIVNLRAPADDGKMFLIPPELARTLPKNWKKFTGHRVGVHRSDGEIYSCEAARAHEPKEARRILLETVFPFWKIDNVKPDSYSQWKGSLVESSQKVYRGKLLFGNAADLPPMEGR